MRLLIGSLLLLMALPAASSPSQALQSCRSCHQDVKSSLPFLFSDWRHFASARIDDDQCVSCHAQLEVALEKYKMKGWPYWIPIPEKSAIKIATAKSYTEIPPLKFKIRFGDRDVRRFTVCGLDRFLARPVPLRFGSRGSMFPVLDPVRKSLLHSLGENLEPCDHKEKKPSAWSLSEGRSLFQAHACRSCHSDQASSSGPRLRIGIPLLTFEYFRERVKLGSRQASTRIKTLNWHQSGKTIRQSFGQENLVMPAFSDLSETDIRAIYEYVVSDTSDLPSAQDLVTEPRPQPASSSLYGIDLFREVEHRVFSTSCRHCHTESVENKNTMARIFSLEIPKDLIVFPLEGRRTVASNELRRVLSPGAECGPSLLVERLRTRHSEWMGKPIAKGASRGMPLTQAPLPDADIDLTERWTRLGCPSDVGNLCEPCRSELRHLKN